MEKIKNIIIEGAGGRYISLDILFNNDGLKKPVIVYAHGFNGFKDWGNFDLVAAQFVKNDLAVVKFNFSHNGTTPEQPEEFADLEAFGNNNYTKQLIDLEFVLNWICDPSSQFYHAFDTDRISLIGHSMGGGIAILYAARDIRIKQLVTWAAISECKTPWGSWSAERLEIWKDLGVQYYTNTRTNQQMPLYYQLYEDYQNNAAELNIENAIKSLSIPILICHGSLDISVPVESAYQLLEWQPSAALFIVESNHVFDRKHPWIVTYLPEAMKEVIDKTIEFLHTS